MKISVAELQSRFRSHAALAISLESGRCTVDLVRREHGESRVVKSFVLQTGAEEAMAQPERVGEELGVLLDSAGIRQRQCVVCIPAGWALTAPTEIPEIAGEDLRGYLELRAEREFPVPIGDLRIAHCRFTRGEAGQHAMLAAVPARRLDAVQRLLEAAGCLPVSISLGLDHCLRQGDHAPQIHFLANGTHVQLVVSAGGGFAALRSLPGAVANGTATFDPTSFSREVRITLGRLPEPMRRQVKEAHFGGTRSSAEVLRRALSESLGKMGIASKSAREEVVMPGSPPHAGAAVEAARIFLAGERAAFEFVAPETSRWEILLQRFDTRKRRYLIGAGLALVILPLAIFMVRSRIESNLEEEWKGMESRVADLEAMQGKIRQFRPWFDGTPRNVAMLEGLASAFPEQGDAWAKSIETADGSKVTCTGFARNQAALMALLDRLRSRPDISGVQVQQVRGDNPVQFSVTYKWEAQNAQ